MQYPQSSELSDLRRNGEVWIRADVYVGHRGHQPDLCRKRVNAVHMRRHVSDSGQEPYFRGKLFQAIEINCTLPSEPPKPY